MEQESNSRRTVYAVVGVFVLLLLVVVALGIVQQPTVDVQDIGDWGEVSETAIGVDSTMTVQNRYPFDLTSWVSDLDYELWLNGHSVARGTVTDSEIPSGNSTVIVASQINRNQIPVWLVSHIQNNEQTDVAVRGSAQFQAGPVSPEFKTTRTSTFETGIVDSLRRSLESAEGSYSGPSGTQEITIDNTRAEWGEVSSQETDLAMSLDITNNAVFPVAVTGVSGGIRMNDIPMAQLETKQDRAVIPPGDTEKIVITATLNTQRFDDWLASHVEQDEHTNMIITLTPKLESEDNGFSIEGPSVACSGAFETQLFVDDQVRSVVVDGCEREGLSVDKQLGENIDIGEAKDNIKDKATETKENIEDRTDEVRSEESSPDAVATATATRIERGDEVTFDASGSSDTDNDIRRYLWQIQGPTAGGTGERITRRFPRVGEYEVTLIVIDSQGHRSTDTVTITVERRF